MKQLRSLIGGISLETLMMTRKEICQVSKHKKHSEHVIFLFLFFYFVLFLFFLETTLLVQEDFTLGRQTTPNSLMNRLIWYTCANSGGVLGWGCCGVAGYYITLLT